MPAMLLLLAAAAPQINPIVIRDPPAGPRPGEEHTFSQPHPDPRMFPDLAVQDLRIDGSTLFVLVANQGGVRAKGPIRVAAMAEADGIKAEAAPARLGKLEAGEKRWLALKSFSVKTASRASAMPLFALQDANFVAASVTSPPPVPSALDRSGRGSDNVDQDLDQTNNGITRAAEGIVHGHP